MSRLFNVRLQLQLHLQRQEALFVRNFAKQEQPLLARQQKKMAMLVGLGQEKAPLAGMSNRRKGCPTY